MDEFTIHKLDTNDEQQLACWYDRQTNPQDVYLWIDKDAASITYDGEIGNAVPSDVWHGLTRRFGLPGVPTATAANWLLDELADDIRAVAAGLSEEWDGSNMIGKLSEDGQAASERLNKRLDDEYLFDPDNDVVSFWDACDWLYDCRHQLGITADMTDEQLEAKANDIEEEAGPNVYLRGTEEYLRNMRDELRTIEEE